MRDFFRYAIRANVIIFSIAIVATLCAASVALISLALGIPWQGIYLGMVALSLIIATVRLVKERKRAKNAR